MNNIGNKIDRFFLTLWLLLFSSFCAAAIQIDVRPNPIIANEAFQLIFTSDENIDADPDFSVFNKIATILAQKQSSNFQMINGKTRYTKQWQLTLVTDQTGAFTIPSLHFGNTQSPAQTINITSATTSKNQQTPEIEIEVQVDTTSPYVQAQVLYTVKLYLKQTLSINNADLSEPIIKHGQAIIERLGQDQQYQTQRNGIAYDVIERQYTIFPQISGKLSIPPLTFQATTGNQFWLFDPFSKQQARRLIKRSKTIPLEVKPIPKDFTGDTWLPAKKLIIQEQWSIRPEQLQQNQAATRTLILKAVGLTASQLPLVNSPIQKQFKQYPDQAEFENQHDDQDYIATRRDKMAIIPTTSGEFILPAIQLHWWNTTTDSMAIAELPERRIQVAATSTQNTSQDPIPQRNNEIIHTAKTIAAETTDTTVKPLLNWQYISLLLLVLWLATLCCWWHYRYRNQSLQTTQDKHKQTHHVSIKQLQQACKNNNPDQAKQALLQWAKKHWANVNTMNISVIKSYSDLAFQQKLDALNQQLYGKANTHWDGLAFLNCFQAQSFKQQQKTTSPGQLEPLYKINPSGHNHH